IGTAGTFPDDITLASNATVKAHLRHLPDPAVRPGAMDFFGSAISAPQAADVTWLDAAELTLRLSDDRPSLGQPIQLRFELTNRSDGPLPVPASFDVESLVVRVNVTDPQGRITFIRPANILSCPRWGLNVIEPGKSIEGATDLFWGRDGFAFESPGRHVIEVIVLWTIGGVQVATSAEQDVFVSYPLTKTDNDVAALLLHPDVGRAVAAKNVWQ